MDQVVIDVEMQETVAPDKFIEELYEFVRDLCKRESIYPDDFLYQGIPISTDNGETVWWFSSKHPIALMLRENNITPCGKFQGPLGKIEVYTNRDVTWCRDGIVGLCSKYGFSVKGPPPPPPSAE